MFKDKNHKNHDVGINSVEYEQAKYIVEVLNQDFYKKDVSSVFADLYKTAKPELLSLFKTAGFAMKYFDKLESYESPDVILDDYHEFGDQNYAAQSAIGLDDIFQNDATLPFPGLEFILKQNPVIGLENLTQSDW